MTLSELAAMVGGGSLVSILATLAGPRAVRFAVSLVRRGVVDGSDEAPRRALPIDRDPPITRGSHILQVNADIDRHVLRVEGKVDDLSRALLIQGTHLEACTESIRACTGAITDMRLDVARLAAKKG
jgi:hypothetical protein